MKRIVQIVIALIAFTAAGAAAQEFRPLGFIADFWDARAEGIDRSEPLVTDRPDFTEASSTVQLGVIQLESGYTFVYNDSAADGTITRTHGGPEALWRIGLTENIEGRILWNYAWESVNSGGSTTQRDGADDLYLGTKLYLNEQLDWIPESSVILQGTVPTGARAFTNEDVSVGINWLYAWDLPLGWSLAGSTGIDTATEDFDAAAPLLGPVATLPNRDRHVVWHQSVTAGIPITELTGMYFEYFGLYTSGRNNDFSQNFINAGITRLVGNDIQLDVRAGKGLDTDADDFFAGAGISIRF